MKLIRLIALASMSILATMAISAQMTIPDDLEGTSWVLQDIIVDGESFEIISEQDVTLEFTDGQMSGFTGCNSFFTSFIEDDDGEFVIGSTLMACFPESLMEQEQLYLNALSAAADLTRDGDTLTINYGEANQLIFAVQQAEDNMTVTNDNFVTGIVMLRDATSLTQLPEDAVITITLADISLMDAPSVTLSEARLIGFPTLPLPFALGYDPTEIQDNMMIAVRAEVRDGEGNLLFISDTVHPVLTRDATNTTTVELVPVQR